MSIIDRIEKLINEHGSAAILREQLSLANGRVAALESQVTENQSKIAKLEARLEIESTSHQNTREVLQQLRAEHEEEIRIHKTIEFRRGKRTGGVWIAFCPKCHAPAVVEGREYIGCSDNQCSWITSHQTFLMRQFIAQL